MATAAEFRQYASECLHWATEVETDEDRQAFLDMARDWTLAALRLEGASVLSLEAQDSQSKFLF